MYEDVGGHPLFQGVDLIERNPASTIWIVPKVYQYCPTILRSGHSPVYHLMWFSRLKVPKSEVNGLTVTVQVANEQRSVGDQLARPVEGAS